MVDPQSWRIPVEAHKHLLGQILCLLTASCQPEENPVDRAPVPVE